MQAPPRNTSAHREESEAERWGRSREARVAELLRAQPQLRAQHAAASEAYAKGKQELLRAAALAPCRQCCAQGSCQLFKSQQVLVLALQFAALLDVPILRCARCNAFSSPYPLEVCPSPCAFLAAKQGAAQSTVFPQSLKSISHTYVPLP